MPRYEAVIGLEVHAQLRTESKLFCACSTARGAPPNRQTCPVCRGEPGALPVLNRRAVDLAVRCALALGGEVRERSVFARKNYFYPDLPKGYQITQYEDPLATGGAVAIETVGGVRHIGIVRLQLEEDAGKSVLGAASGSHGAVGIDLNRAGIPLVEIVSRPEMSAPGEAYAFLERLRSVLRYADVCDGELHEGSLRCDANVSLRPSPGGPLAARTEVKNLNSFRNVERALRHEIGRQAAALETGDEPRRETRGWDSAAGETRILRTKEVEEDYRYFPEPDLPPLVIDRERVERARREIPELPGPRKARFVRQYALPAAEAHRLTLHRGLADWYESAAASGHARIVARFALNDLRREQKKVGRSDDDIALAPERMAELAGRVADGSLSMDAAHALFPELYATGARPMAIAEARGLAGTVDPAVLRERVAAAIRSHPREADLVRSGRGSVLSFFVGQIVRDSGGRADPRIVDSLVRDALRREDG